MELNLVQTTAIDHYRMVMECSGCQENCGSKVHHLSEMDIVIPNQRFQNMTCNNQRQWLIDYLHSNTSKESNQTIFLISGKVVCQPVWLATLGISRSRFYEIRKAYLHGAMNMDQPAKQVPRRAKTHKAISWMNSYFNQVGDHMPDKLAIHLPSFLTRSLVYERMKEDLGTDTISSSHFHSLWMSDFSHVTIPKVCSYC